MKENKVMKLEEGMYVRFKDKRGSHYIRKITSVNTEYPGKLYYKYDNKYLLSEIKGDIRDILKEVE